MTVTKRDFIVFLEFLLLLVIGFSVDSVQAKLTIAKECGELVCKPHNYCSQVDHSCRPCQVACDPALGNYDKDVCEKFCQGRMSYACNITNFRILITVLYFRLLARLVVHEKAGERVRLPGRILHRTLLQSAAGFETFEDTDWNCNYPVNNRHPGPPLHHDLLQATEEQVSSAAILGEKENGRFASDLQ